MDLSNQNAIIYGDGPQPGQTAGPLAIIGLLAVIFVYLVGLFYQGIEALSRRPPSIRVVGIALGVAALSFLAIHDGPSSGHCHGAGDGGGWVRHSLHCPSIVVRLCILVPAQSCTCTRSMAATPR